MYSKIQLFKIKFWEQFKRNMGIHEVGFLLVSYVPLMSMVETIEWNEKVDKQTTWRLLVEEIQPRPCCVVELFYKWVQDL